MIAERRTWIVVAITTLMMIAELAAGWLFNSMAVTADGWHMSTHAAALSLAGIAFAYSRRASRDDRYAFGPWKIEALGGYTSAVLLAGVALFMAGTSVRRMFEPLEIRYGQALLVAVIGLLVNVASALILRGRAGHGRAGHGRAGHGRDGHDSAAGEPHRLDLNTRAAYMHVLADAMTSVLAIVALTAGRLFGLRILDPVMGVVGGIIICRWAYGLLKESIRVLLDREMDNAIVGRIRAAIERDGASRVSDLHVWRVGRSKFACDIQIVAPRNLAASDYRRRLRDQDDVAHLTVEVIHEEERPVRGARRPHGA